MVGDSVGMKVGGWEVIVAVIGGGLGGMRLCHGGCDDKNKVVFTLDLIPVEFEVQRRKQWLDCFGVVPSSVACTRGYSS